MIKAFRILLGFAALLMSSVACVDLGVSGPRSHRIIPVVKSISGTKSGPVIVDDRDFLGSGLNTENIKNNGFVMNAWLATAGEDGEGNTVPAGEYFQPTDVLWNGSSWALGTEKSWIKDVRTEFWCWNRQAAGLSPASGYDGATLRRFDYNAAANNDLVMAHVSDTWDDESQTDKPVNLTFHHPLANVCFDCSLADGITITSVRLSGIHTSGSFVYSGGDSFVWDGFAGAGSETMSETVGSDVRYVNFFVIPQSTANAYLHVVYSQVDSHGNTNIQTKAVSLASAGVTSLAADNYYKFRLNRQGEIVDDGFGAMDELIVKPSEDDKDGDGGDDGGDDGIFEPVTLIDDKKTYDIIDPGVEWNDVSYDFYFAVEFVLLSEHHYHQHIAIEIYEVGGSGNYDRYQQVDYNGEFDNYRVYDEHGWSPIQADGKYLYTRNPKPGPDGKTRYDANDAGDYTYDFELKKTVYFNPPQAWTQGGHSWDVNQLRITGASIRLERISIVRIPA